jgi:hypothetical protein
VFVKENARERYGMLSLIGSAAASDETEHQHKSNTSTNNSAGQHVDLKLV